MVQMTQFAGQQWRLTWRASLEAQVVKIWPQCGRPCFDPWVGRMPWRRERLPTPVLLPGESHGQRSLAGQSMESQRVRHNWATCTSIFSADIDIENRLVDRVEEGKGGTDWENSIRTYVHLQMCAHLHLQLPYVKQITSGDLLYEAGSSNPVTYDNLEGWDGMGVGREVQEGGVTCIPVTDSYGCMAETNTTL